jgi:ribosomal protein S4
MSTEQNKIELQRDESRLRHFREAARRLLTTKQPASEMKLMLELYDAMGTSARYSAEIFWVELTNGLHQK